MQQRCPQAVPCGTEQLSQLVSESQGSALQALRWTRALCLHLAPLGVFHLILWMRSLPPAIPSAAAAVLSAWLRQTGLHTGAAWEKSFHPSPSWGTALGGEAGPITIRGRFGIQWHVLVPSQSMQCPLHARKKVGSSCASCGFRCSTGHLSHPVLLHQKHCWECRRGQTQLCPSLLSRVGLDSALS